MTNTNNAAGTSNEGSLLIAKQSEARGNLKSLSSIKSKKEKNMKPKTYKSRAKRSAGKCNLR